MSIIPQQHGESKILCGREWATFPHLCSTPGDIFQTQFYVNKSFARLLRLEGNVLHFLLNPKGSNFGIHLHLKSIACIKVCKAFFWY